MKCGCKLEFSCWTRDELDELDLLYKHWRFHVVTPELPVVVTSENPAATFSRWPWKRPPSVEPHSEEEEEEQRAEGRSSNLRPLNIHGLCLSYSAAACYQDIFLQYKIKHGWVGNLEHWFQWWILSLFLCCLSEELHKEDTQTHEYKISETTSKIFILFI